MNNSVEDVIRWLDLNQLEFWTVSKSKQGNSKVFEPLDDESLLERKQRFRDTMKLLPATWFVVQAKRVKNQTTGQFEYEFTNGSTEQNTISGMQQLPPVVNGIPKEEVNELIQRAIEEDHRKQELEDLRRQNKELKKELDENGGAFGRIIKRAEPVIGMLIDRVIPARPTIQVAGIERMNDNDQSIEFDKIKDEHDGNFEYTEQTDDETMERIQSAIQKWSDADPEFLPLLEFIADFASSGRTINAGFVELSYNSVKSMLK